MGDGRGFFFGKKNLDFFWVAFCGGEENCLIFMEHNEE